MSIEDEENGPHGYASPACVMHEVDPAYVGLEPIAACPTWINDWRKNERQRLVTERRCLASTDRERKTKQIRCQLDVLLTDVNAKTISVYWPIRGEPDLRGWMADLNERGATCLLPIVAQRRQPLTFRSWRRGEKLGRGIWNIPIPVDGEELIPDILIAPVVGFDEACFRLGYGGGYFDRTLAARDPKPMIIGVGFALQHVPTIHPLLHDIPMDAIITENQTLSPREFLL